jgi:hypothetical protein
VSDAQLRLVLGGLAFGGLGFLFGSAAGILATLLIAVGAICLLAGLIGYAVSGKGEG